MNGLHIKGGCFLGIDLGSVSLNLVVIDEDAAILKSIYRRTEGRPLHALRRSLEELGETFSVFHGVNATGSGRKLLAEVLGVADQNEIVTQARATCHRYPEIRTIIEIGGQDAKLIFLAPGENGGEPAITDHVLNEVCAAGTGSFLDLQAHRLGISVAELGGLALKSQHPARISGRCSVFAKSDMVHLLQEGTPKPDIVAGLCHALAMNYISNLGKGKPFVPPVAFQGGVAANPGVVRALEEQLGMGPGGLTIPENYLVMGAFGSALKARQAGRASTRPVSDLVSQVSRHLEGGAGSGEVNNYLTPLIRPRAPGAAVDRYYETRLRQGCRVFLGIDVGAVSTNIVLVDTAGQVVAKQYWYTQGELIRTVRDGLEEMGRKLGEQVEVIGVGVTGSGRYFVGDFVGADVVINEISAQAKAAMFYDPRVDTILEIGGQDAKYIRCRDGRVVHFEMNKVCAAGTGSFLEEQAARLKVPVREGFSELAFSARRPANLGARCTVFMESDLIHHQQTGKTIEDLTAGLAYAIAQNYREKVMGNRSIGRHILFQGGVAGNQSVTAAFENLLGRPVTVPAHHNVTGAMGAALAAREAAPGKSRFVGFYLKDRPYELKPFTCDRCPNVCRINQIYIDGRLRSRYGGLCGRYDRSAAGPSAAMPDIFQERRERLLAVSDGALRRVKQAGETVGIPRVLSFHDYFPFWNAYFQALGHPVILSEPTHKGLVRQGLTRVPSETCFPIKAVYGHVTDLMEKGADRIFLPCEMNHHQPGERSSPSFNCPYVQAIPYMVEAAMGSQVRLLAPIIQWRGGRQAVDGALRRLARSLGHGGEESDRAAGLAWKAYGDFIGWQKRRGREILQALGPDEQAVILLGKGHNCFDPGLNLHLAGKLRREGRRAIPFDMIDTGEVVLPAHYENVVWKNTRDLLKVLIWMERDPRLFPVLVTNFGCGPDSFLIKYLEAEISERPYLILEVDDHTGDAGMITRIEAFLDTLDIHRRHAPLERAPLNLITRSRNRKTHGWEPSRAIMKRLENRTLFFPYVSRSYCSIVKAAFDAVGVSSKVLPTPDEETERLGRQYTSGRECHPYIVTCGEFVKLTRRPGFDPDQSALLMQNYDGACRFSQYGIGHADLFRRLGLSRVPVVAPLTSPRLDEFSALFGLRFTRLLWQGWMAAEVLERIRLHVRPYEIRPGDTEQAFGRGISAIAEAVSKSGGGGVWDGGILSACRQSAGALKAVPVDRSTVRPVIGILGEFYTVLNRWANQDLAMTIEGLGGEAALHGLTVPNFYAFFSGHYYPKRRLKAGAPGAAAYYWLRDRWMMGWVRQVEAFLPEALRPLGTLAAGEIVRESDPFVYHDIDPVLATFTARVRRFAARGVSGICNLFVLNCMLGNITVPVFKRALAEYKGLPVLHAVYDGQEGTNMLTRIEAFMHQAARYQKPL